MRLAGGGPRKNLHRRLPSWAAIYQPSAGNSIKSGRPTPYALCERYGCSQRSIRGVACARSVPADPSEDRPPLYHWCGGGSKR